MQIRTVHEETKQALRQAILRCLPTFHKLSAQLQEAQPAWSKREDGAWIGEDRPKPDLFQIFRAADKQVEEATSEFSSLFFSQHPEYGEGKLVGCAGLGSMQLAHNKSHILRKAIGWIWDRHETFNCSEESVNAVVNEFVEFVDSPILQIHFQAELLNFQMSGSHLQLTEKLRIRRLSEREVSNFQSRAIGHGFQRFAFGGIHEFVIEGEIEGLKTLAGQQSSLESPYHTARAQLDKAVLCLRTFKEGCVGYDWIRFKFIKFCPLDAGSYGISDLHCPSGTYRVHDNEIALLHDHARKIFDLSEPAMETACARLADAEARFRPQDQILDAVIGMEALLLAALKEKTELKFRFSLNYSALFTTPKERWRAYKLAKNLYDHRSIIAHGDSLPDKDIRVGEEKMTLHKAAECAKNTLRKLIHDLLPQSKTAPYKRAQFWEHGYFGLPESEA